MNWARRLSSISSPVGRRGAVALLALLGVVYELDMPHEAVIPAAADSTEKPAAVQRNSGDRASPKNYPAIDAHPLFSPTRRPWVPPPLTAGPAQSPSRVAVKPQLRPPNGYVLVGIVLSGAVRTALLRSANGSSTILLKESDALDGWVLRRIEDQRLHFAAGGATYEMTFPESLSTPPGRISHR